MRLLIQNSKIVVLLIGLVLLCAIAYWPGLKGGFLFDDFGNLDTLGALGSVHDWTSFCRYITSGHADPTGRPVTMLTFLIDAQDWPAVPLPFKRTNLLIHLLNGGLLCTLLIQLGQLAHNSPRRVRLAALVASGLWLLHPLLVSTTLYVVQREAMLSTTFVMLGLVAWLHGRHIWLVRRQPLKGIIWCLAGLMGCTVLGTLAKANGVLLPILALVIESCFPAPTSSNPKVTHLYRRLLLLIAGLPSVLLVGYLAWIGAKGIVAGGVISGRSWTLGQRLLSEPRVVMDYLELLWLPRALTNGLFNDQYAASTSLFHPLSTAFALAAAVGMVTTAWLIRRRHPVLATAVLFFFAGQLLESTTIPLELYYEHRNYLPALLMFWPLSWWLADGGTLSGLKRALMFGLPLGLALMTYQRAIEWGNSDSQALLWAHFNPYSPRAQAYAATIEIKKGLYASAVNRMEAALSRHPAEPQLAFNLINAYCGMGDVPEQAIFTATSAVRLTIQRGALYSNWLGDALHLAQTKSCKGLTFDGIRQIVDAGLANPALHVPATQQDLVYVQAQIEVAQGQPTLALGDFRRALDIQVRPEVALSAASVLGSAGYPSLGLTMLNYYESTAYKAQVPDPGMPHLHAWVLAYQNYWPKEVAHLRRQLITDAMARHATP